MTKQLTLNKREASVDTLRFSLVVMLVSVTVYALLIFSAVRIAKFQASTSVEIAAELVKNNLLAGDLREPIIKLQMLAMREFNEIIYVDRNGQEVFHLEGSRPNISVSQLFEQRISITLAPGSEAKLNFTYSLTNHILFASAIFAALALAAVWPVLLLVRKLKRENLRALEQQRREILVDLAERLTHDIRSPLTALRMVISTSVPAETEARELADKAFQRIESMASSVLKSSKESALETSTQSKWSVLPTLRALLQEKRVEYGTRQKIRLVDDLKIDISTTLALSEAESCRVISNLLNNSFEALGDEEGTVTLSARLEAGKLIVCVSDTGPGMPESLLYDLGKTRISTKPSGNGIGIRNARKAMIAHGGSLTFNSRLGEGTIATLKFPVA